MQTVPPRPQLSYTVQQQREIVEALIADRENARYTNQVVRYRSGLSSLPPPPAPPAPAPTAVPPVEPGAGPSSPGPDLSQSESDAAAGTTEDVLGEDTFEGFLRALSRHFDSDDPEAAAPEATAPDTASGSSAPQRATGQDSAALPEPPEATANEPSAMAPRPPADTAATARRDLIPQASAPLPPPQTASAARQVAPDQTRPAHAAPIPALHPERATLTGRAGSGPGSPPEPPPVKPQVEASLDDPLARPAANGSRSGATNENL